MQDYERKVLEQYDIDIRSTRKIRGAVLCDTNRGLYLLKEMSVSEERMAALCELYEYMSDQEWCGVDEILKNKEEIYITKLENGDKYILKHWFEGRECDVRRPGELLDAAGMLAKLHILMQVKLENPVVRADSLKEEYQKHNRELKKVRSFIRKSTAKGEFEFEFLKNFDQMYQWAEVAGDLLNNSEYKNLYRENMEKNCLVHGEYNYHNVLMDHMDNKSTIIAVTNFDKFKRDIQVEDFYYFLRKTMEKYGWKERLGDNMINAYSAVKPLSKQEMEYIKIRLAYPEKFWKTANIYYHSNKAWISVKNIEKLGVAIRQTQEKERFLKNVFSFGL